MAFFVGVFELAQTGRSRHTHRTQVSLYAAHGIPWLEHKISNHGYPTRWEGLCFGGVEISQIPKVKGEIVVVKGIPPIYGDERD